LAPYFSSVQGRRPDHQTSPSRAALTELGSALPSIRTRAWPKSISITPIVDARADATAQGFLVTADVILTLVSRIESDQKTKKQGSWLLGSQERKFRLWRGLTGSRRECEGPKVRRRQRHRLGKRQVQCHRTLTRLGRRASDRTCLSPLSQPGPACPQPSSNAGSGGWLSVRTNNTQAVK